MFARAVSASLFALIAAHAIGPAAAAEAAPRATKELCAAYLADLDIYRQLAITQGCEIPGDEVAAAASPAPLQAAAVETDPADFPPVVDDVPAAPAQDFPPVVDEASAPPKTEFPPVDEAANDPAPAKLPPVVSEADPKPSNTGGDFPPVVSSPSGGSSGNFPPVDSSSAGTGAIGMEDETDPGSEVREAIKEKLFILKETAKQRVKDAIILKAEEAKERVKEKIKDKIEAAIERRNGGGSPAPTLRGGAKDAIKRAIVERHRGGGLMSRLSQLRRR
jgi:hypothetical protein